MLCKDLGELENGVISCTYSKQVDSICSFECNIGFELVGSYHSICFASGYFNNPLPKCISKDNFFICKIIF